MGIGFKLLRGFLCSISWDGWNGCFIFYFFIEKKGTIFGGEEVIGSVGWGVSG